MPIVGINEVTVPTPDPALVKLTELQTAVETLTATVEELVEKIHDLERNVAYALGE